MTGSPSAQEAASSHEALERFLLALPPVEPVGLERRVAMLATRSVKGAAKLRALDMAISMVDLTTLEGADTPARVRSLCTRAVTPDPGQPGVPSVAAVCVYPDLVGAAVAALGDADVAVASVATAFPAGRSSTAVKLADTALALDAGASEIDMVIDRGAFLAGRHGEVFDEIAAVAHLTHRRGAHLKVILETGELGSYDDVRRAAWLALLAGGDVVKTSTGKISPAATRPVAAVLLRAVRDFEALTGERRGVKVAGGIRTAKDALRYLVLVAEIASPTWLTPRLFRFGASSLLDDLLRQRRAQLTGTYAGAGDVPAG